MPRRSNSSDRTLLGRYRTPRVKPGNTIACQLLGEVEVDGITSDVPIPWPFIARIGGKRCLVLCADLVRAVRRESVEAIAHNWGVSRWSVMRWRRALQVPRFNEGTRRIWSANASKLHRRWLERTTTDAAD